MDSNCFGKITGSDRGGLLSVLSIGRNVIAPEHPVRLSNEKNMSGENVHLVWFSINAFRSFLIIVRGVSMVMNSGNIAIPLRCQVSLDGNDVYYY